MALFGLTLVSSRQLENLMATQTQLAAQIQSITAQVNKSKAEILAKIADLTAAVAAAGVVAPEVETAMAALAAAVQAVDDIVP